MTEAAVQRFKEDVQNTKSLVVCVKCGSTLIDQNFRTQLKCYRCGNVSIWDASRFTIARDSRESDAVRGIQDANEKPIDSWNPAIISALLPMLHRITDMPSIGLADGQDKIRRSDYNELTQLWQQAKEAVDTKLDALADGGILDS